MNKPNTFFTIEIPHTRPAQVCAWPSKQDAVENFRAHLELTMTCDRMTDEEVFEVAGNDLTQSYRVPNLSSFHTFDSLKELDERSQRQRTQHQGLKIRAQVEQLLEDEFIDEVIEDEGPDPVFERVCSVMFSAYDLAHIDEARLCMDPTFGMGRQEAIMQLIHQKISDEGSQS